MKNKKIFSLLTIEQKRKILIELLNKGIVNKEHYYFLVDAKDSDIEEIFKEVMQNV